MTLSEELQWRGQLKDMTFADASWLDTPKTFYLGSDCNSADSLTIGNLGIYMLARRLRKHGWKAVLLVGGATSLIGDPGGKDAERELKTKEEIEANVRGIEAQVQTLFGEYDFTLVNNYDWFKGIGYLEFLREVGKHYSMTELIQRDFIATRLGEGAAGISYAEFSYNLIQGYDYWHLYKNHNVVLQIGGSDQWGNMLSGVPLIRKKEGADAHALSMPLVINKSTGKKFGKSEDGAIWLDDKRTSVYKFYQFWINVDDDAVEDYLKIYTDLTKPEVEDIIEAHNEARSNRLAQKHLAFEVTRIVHGKERAASVQKLSEVLFGGGSYANLNAGDFELLKTELHVVEGSAGSDLPELLVSAQLASSKGEARRHLTSNAIYINGRQLPLEKQQLDADDFIDGFCVIRRGKNTTALVVRQD